MIWHIFKKDWKLLWRLVVGVALLHFALATVLFKLGHFGGSRTLHSLWNMLFMIALLGSAFLIAGVVHQDAIPGVRQDWLVRPVKRLDLLLAKLLFVGLTVQTPILTADLMEALASGFPTGPSFAAALSRSVFLLLGLSLPMLAFASLTKNFMETIVAGVAAFFGGVAFLMLADYNRGYNLIQGTGVGWVTESAWLAVLSLGAVAILGLQYFRRKLVPAIWLTAAVTLLVLFSGFMPWQLAFAIQQRRAPNPAAGKLVAMAFAPEGGKSRAKKAIDDESYRRSHAIDGDLFLYLPLRIDGLPNDSVLKADLSEALLIGPDGRAESLGLGNDLEIRNEGNGDGGNRVHHAIHVRSDIYNRFKDQPVRLEIDYSLTLFRLAVSHGLPALNGDQRTPQAGWCATTVNASGTNVQLRCLDPGKGPTCLSAFLEHTPTGLRNPVSFRCRANYAPFFARLVPDVISRFGVNLPFHDPSGLAQYPVTSKQLRESQVVLRIYEPQDHFTRRVVIQEIRLQDWESGS